MLETIAVLLLQASSPATPVWTAATATPMSDEALLLERAGPRPRGLRTTVSSASNVSASDWSDRFDSAVMSVRLTTQVVEAMMQPDVASFDFNPGFLLTPGTTVTVLATIDGRDFALR